MFDTFRRRFRAELGATVRLAAPVVAAHLAQNSMSFVDTIMVGRLGMEPLAGVALGSTVYFLTLGVSMGMVVAVGPLVAQAFGAADTRQVGAAVRNGLWLSVVLFIPAFFLLRHAGGFLLWIGQDEAAVEGAQAYLRAVVWGFLPALWFVALRSFVEGVARPWPVTLITFLGVGINIFANDTLMFGRYGLPALGLVGTGYATAIVFWIMVGVLFVMVMRAPRLRPYGVFRSWWRLDSGCFRELVRVGWPIGISHGLEGGLFVITAILMGLLGTSALAAHQIAIQCASLTFMAPLGVGIATSVRVGHAVGRKDSAGIGWAGYMGIGLGAAFMIGTAVLFWTVPRTVVSFFLDLDSLANSEVVRMAVMLLGVAAVFQVFDGVQVVASGALRGLKDTRIPMLIALLSYWVIGLSAGLWLGFYLGYGPAGLWWGLVLGLAAAAVLLTWRFVRFAKPAGLATGSGP